MRRIVRTTRTTAAIKAGTGVLVIGGLAQAAAAAGVGSAPVAGVVLTGLAAVAALVRGNRR